MSDEKDRDLSDLFSAPPARSGSATDEARFVDRVSGRLQRRRRVMLALRVILLVAVVVTIAPFVPPFITSFLKIFGL
ncbi:MAG: hypothetical protein WDO68_20030 [Gammaproteobacteria bacterium]